MEEEQRKETLHQIMAALPKVKKPMRRSTRVGAGKRKVHFGDAHNDGWQQLSEFQATPIHAAVASTGNFPFQLPTPAVQRPIMRSTVQRKDQTPEDLEEAKEDAMDLSRMPKSFPIAEAGDQTPGTTNLNEPPQETT